MSFFRVALVMNLFLIYCFKSTLCESFEKLLLFVIPAKAGIQETIEKTGFPPGKCGNDKVLDSRQVIAGMTGGGHWIPACAG